MSLFGASSGSISAPSSDFSSPALPELSLDASLQRLHQQEGFSASSISSAALSRNWRQSHHQGSPDPEPSSPSHSSPLRSQPRDLDRNDAFRFPPLKPAHSSTEQAATGLVGHTQTQTQEPALPARPRTSRGLTHPEPFLSSSRATSIASLAEVDVEPSQQLGTQIAFGTPFATGAFQTSLRDLEPSSSAGPDPSSSGSSIEDLMREFPAPSPKQPFTTIETSSNRVEAHRLHASSMSRSPSIPSSWTLLFTPLEQAQSSREGVWHNPTPRSILLPLQSSFEDQVEHLKLHLVQSLHHEQSSVLNKQVELLLDLSSISALPAKSLARITPQSWSIMFEAYVQGGKAKDEGPLPHLYRKTGLPIAALIRYSLTSSSAFVQDQGTSGRVDDPTSSNLTTQEHNTHDSNPWARRESEMTLLPAHFSKPSPSTRMTASRSYPGVPLTPIRRSPLPYSPIRNASSGGESRHQALAQTPVMPMASPMSHSYSEGSKLRTLSLAAVHPLTPPHGAEVPTGQADRGTAAHRFKGQSLDTGSPRDTANAQHTGRYASKLSGLRLRQQSSRGSSHKSFPSNTTTLSSRSTKDTSMRSSRTHIHTAFDRGGSGSDGDESDDDLGSRFWTQLSSLGEQVSREAKQSGDNAAQRRPRDHRSVSISSTASDASVCDFSPLGILVPTDGPLNAELQDGEKPTTKRVSISSAAQDAGASSTFLSPILDRQTTSILGRRRAYSSMVPLTGWRAGDSDLRTAEGQRSISSGELPQVLVLEPRGDIISNAPGHDHSDLITPTVANLQGRARALSYQHSAGPSFGSQNPGLRKDRQNVWDEAMLQLTERLIRSNIKSSISRQTSPTSNKARRRTSSDVEPRATSDGEALPRSSSPAPHEGHSTGTGSPDVHSSPLPGLFYESWVVRVDGGVDGELGRRGSTFDTRDTIELAETGAQAASTTSRLDPESVSERGSSSSSTSDAVGSGGSEPLLQVLQESDWPRPRPRSERRVSDSRSLLSASTSFLSMESPLVDEEAPRESDASIQSRLSTIGGSDTLNEDAGASLAPPQSELMPVWLTRSQAIWDPQTSEPSIASDRVCPPNTTLPSSDDLMSNWADLAQRLRSPGSMRLLCLAASSLTVAELGASAQDLDVGSSRSSTMFGTGLDVPFRAADTVMTRSRSLSAVAPSISSTNDSTGSAGRGPSGAVEDYRHRSLARKKAELLAPIRIPLQSEQGSGATGSEASTQPSRPIASSRMKRSLSNIFDLPSPIDARPHQQQQ